MQNSSPATPSEERNGSSPNASAAGASIASSHAAARRQLDPTWRRRLAETAHLRELAGPPRRNHVHLDRAGGTDRLVDHRPVPELVAPRPPRGAQNQLVSLLGAHEIEHRGGDIDRRDLRVTTAESEQQALLALQPRRRTTNAR
jgi:hypothetical protein